MSSNPTWTMSGLPAWLGCRSILSMPQGSRVLGWPKQRTFSIPAHLLRASRPGRCAVARQSKASFRPVALRPEGRIETFKYRASELICEACGPDFQTAMIHASPGGKQSTSPVRPRLAPRAWRLKTTYRARRHNLHRSRWKALAHGSWLFGEFTEARRSRNIRQPCIIPG